MLHANYFRVFERFLEHINLNCELLYACLVLKVEQNFLQTNNEPSLRKSGKRNTICPCKWLGLQVVQMTMYKRVLKQFSH